MTKPYDHLDKTDRQEIEKLAKNGFRQLEPTHHKTADLYYVTLPSRKECCIKLFQTEHVELYEVENQALRSLSLSGRVSPVLYSHPDPEDPNPFKFGEHRFLVKPHYKRFLDTGAKRTRLLDDAAQLTSLAMLLKEAGWCDFDENWDNEAFDEGGRLIRFDMDAAFNYKSLSPKSDRSYQGPRAYEQYQKLSEACMTLGREDVALVTAAVKTCRFLLNRRGDCPPLDRQLSAAAPAGNDAANAHGESAAWTRKAGDGFMRFLRGLSGASRSQSVSIKPPAGPAPAPAKAGVPTEKDEAEWLGLWKERLVGNLEPRFFPLSIAESHFLGLMFGHVLRGAAADWKLEDLRQSLLLLLAGTLQRLAAEYAEKDPLAFRALVEELHEFKGVTQEKAREIAQRPKAEPPRPTQVLKIAMDGVVMAGDAWASTRKQGMDSCEDLVMKYEAAPFPFFVLADGESNAQGGVAVKELAAQCGRLNEEMTKKPDARAPKEWVALLVRRTNEALLKLGARTTAVIAMLSNNPAASVVLAQFGNSPWVFVKDDPEGGAPHAQVNLRNCDDKVLGKSAITSDEWVTEEISEISLEAASYRIRAHSDGIPQNLRNIFKESVPIRDIVAEVDRWGRERSADVGHDDRSVAGFDFSVSEVTVQPAKSKRESQPPAPGAIDWLAVCEGIPHETFKLSPSARTFWQQTLGTAWCKALREYQVFKDAGLVVGEVAAAPAPAPVPAPVPAPAPAPAPQKPETAPQKPEAAKARPIVATSKPLDRTEQTAGSLSLSLTDFGAWLRKNTFEVVLCLILASLVVALGYVIWFYNIRKADGDANSNGNAVATAPQSAPSATLEPTFNDQYTRELFNRLNKEGASTFGPLAPGDGIDAEPLKTVIPALTEILRKTSLNVAVEVHSSLDGEPAANFKMTKDRGGRIVARLKESGIPESRVKSEPKGDREPRHPRPRTNVEALENRRIVIRVLK